MEQGTMHVSLIRFGARRGAKTGLILSFLYIFVFWLYIVVTDRGYDLETAIMVLLLFLFYGSVLGVLPSVALGAITGYLIGKTFDMQGSVLSDYKALSISLFICLAIAAFLNLLALLLFFNTLSLTSSQFGGYFIYLGLPSIIYLLGGSWMSVRAYRDIRARG
ncbi:MAG TPA: hypothetical protein VF707_02555 [Ardenticatenaceae bacterium]|jgi:hypothetical protein